LGHCYKSRRILKSVYKYATLRRIYDTATICRSCWPVDSGENYFCPSLAASCSRVAPVAARRTNCDCGDGSAFGHRMTSLSSARSLCSVVRMGALEVRLNASENAAARPAQCRRHARNLHGASGLATLIRPGALKGRSSGRAVFFLAPRNDSQHIVRQQPLLREGVRRPRLKPSVNFGGAVRITDIASGGQVRQRRWRRS
jgi:hypothetical protein